MKSQQVFIENIIQPVINISKVIRFFAPQKKNYWLNEMRWLTRVSSLIRRGKIPYGEMMQKEHRSFVVVYYFALIVLVNKSKTLWILIQNRR